MSSGRTRRAARRTAAGSSPGGVEDVDGVVGGAVGDDEPLVVGEDDAGLSGGVGGGAAGGVAARAGRAVSGAGRGAPGRLPAAAGEGGGGLGGERGRREDAAASRTSSSQRGMPPAGVAGAVAVTRPRRRGLTGPAAPARPGGCRGRARRGWPLAVAGPAAGGCGGRGRRAGAGRWRAGPAAAPPGLLRRRGGRVRRGQHGPGVDDVRVGADGLPVGGVQGLPAAGHARGRRRWRTGCRPARRCTGRAAGARDGQHGAGADELRVGADGVPVGGVQGLPAAGHAEGGGDGGQGVAGPHGPRAGGAAGAAASRRLARALVAGQASPGCAARAVAWAAALPAFAGAWVAELVRYCCVAAVCLTACRGAAVRLGGGSGPRRPVTATRARASQASTRTRTWSTCARWCFPSWGRRRAATASRAPGSWAWGKEADYAGGTSGSDERQTGRASARAAPATAGTRPRRPARRRRRRPGATPEPPPVPLDPPGRTRPGRAPRAGRPGPGTAGSLPGATGSELRDRRPDRPTSRPAARRDVRYQAPAPASRAAPWPPLAAPRRRRAGRLLRRRPAQRPPRRWRGSPRPAQARATHAGATCGHSAITGVSGAVTLASSGAAPGRLPGRATASPGPALEPARPSPVPARERPPPPAGATRAGNRRQHRRHRRMTGATAPVTGASTPVAVDTTGATALVTGARTWVAVRH